MSDANFPKERIEFFIFASPICLNCKNFPIKLSLNKFLEILKNREDIRFELEEINPGKLAIVINKTNIVFIPSK